MAKESILNLLGGKDWYNEHIYKNSINLKLIIELPNGNWFILKQLMC